MATIKHTSSKNSDLSAAERYLTFQHNEYTGLPILEQPHKISTITGTSKPVTTVRRSNGSKRLV